MPALSSYNSQCAFAGSRKSCSTIEPPTIQRSRLRVAGEQPAQRADERHSFRPASSRTTYQRGVPPQARACPSVATRPRKIGRVQVIIAGRQRDADGAHTDALACLACTHRAARWLRVQLGRIIMLRTPLQVAEKRMHAAPRQARPEGWHKQLAQRSLLKYEAAVAEYAPQVALRVLMEHGAEAASLPRVPVELKVRQRSCARHQCSLVVDPRRLCPLPLLPRAVAHVATYEGGRRCGRIRP
eukprot:scaffold4882_cov70-Phaeocystis_antarctica.AAC.13